VQISFEVYPPRKEEDTPKLHEAILRLSELDPDFISVTFGAGGSSTRDSLSVLKFIRDNSTASPLAHLTCVGTTEADAKELVNEFLSEGIHDFLALRGDLPEGQTSMPPGTLSRADQLVRLIGEVRSDGLGKTAVAAFPNGHPESGSDRSDIQALLAKQEAGASLAITQLFSFAEEYRKFLELARGKGVAIDLIPGIMPIVSPSRLARVLELTGEREPEKLAKQLREAKDAGERREAGIEWAALQLRQLADAGVDAVHLYAFNEFANVTEVLRRAGVV
jgi:methylenetetrahydrofolate reductase (NADPH)